MRRLTRNGVPGFQPSLSRPPIVLGDVLYYSASSTWLRLANFDGSISTTLLAVGSVLAFVAALIGMVLAICFARRAGGGNNHLEIAHRTRHKGAQWPCVARLNPSSQVRVGGMESARPVHPNERHSKWRCARRGRAKRQHLVTQIRACNSKRLSSLRCLLISRTPQASSVGRLPDILPTAGPVRDVRCWCPGRAPPPCRARGACSCPRGPFRNRS
jgi:hypothetical protein